MKTAELTGAALDWSVAKCEGRVFNTLQAFIGHHDIGRMNYSTDWAQGGPIIERESIAVDYSDGTASESGKPYWCAAAYYSDARPQAAETPLIAAMRCYVASKLGEDVDIPDELVV